MSPNLAESTRLAQSLTSSSNGNARDWPIESVNSGANSLGFSANSVSLLDSSAGGASTIALGSENFTTNQSSLFQSNLGSYSSVNTISAGSGLLGSSTGPVGPSSGMSYKAVTLSKQNSDSKKSSIYKLEDSHNNLTLATPGSPSLPLGAGSLSLNTASSSNLDKTRPLSSSNGASGRLGSNNMNLHLKRTQLDNDSADRYDSGKGSNSSNGTSNSSKSGSSKAGVNTSTSSSEPSAKHSVLSEEQLATFRTSFCANHHQNNCPNSDSCEKSHCLTWQRRNPYEISYCPHLCPEIQFVKKSRKMVLYRRCTRGKNCNFAHSKEEELYHPLVYKTKQCSSYPKCTRYFCPFVHEPSEMRDASKFMFEGYPVSKGKGFGPGGEILKEDGRSSKKGNSSSDSKASPGLDADGYIDTDRVDVSQLDPNKETYREDRHYMMNTADYENYNIYTGYANNYNQHNYTAYDNEYGDEYNSQFAKDYPVYNKEYQNQFTSSYGAGEYGVSDEVDHLDKDDQMTQFENLDVLDTTYGIDTVDRLESTNYYNDGLRVGVNNRLSVEGMWSAVNDYNSVNDPSISASNYQSAHHEYHQSYHSGQLPTSYQSYQNSSYHHGYKQGYRRASYKDAYQRQYNQHHYQSCHDNGDMIYNQDDRYNQGYQTYGHDYVDKDYYTNYPDLPTSNPNLSSTNVASVSSSTGVNNSTVSASNREGTINQSVSASAATSSGKMGTNNQMSSNISSNNGDMSTSYSNYNSADNYHSPGTSYQSSDNTGSAYTSGYPSNYSGNNYANEYLDAANTSDNYLQSTSSSYLQTSSSTSNYLHNYYQDQDLGTLQYELEDQFDNLGLSGTLSMSNELNMNTTVDLNPVMDRTLELNTGLDLNSSMDGGMELNDMFVKIINEIEK